MKQEKVDKFFEEYHETGEFTDESAQDIIEHFFDVTNFIEVIETLKTTGEKLNLHDEMIFAACCVIIVEQFGLEAIFQVCPHELVESFTVANARLAERRSNDRKS